LNKALSEGIAAGKQESPPLAAGAAAEAVSGGGAAAGVDAGGGAVVVDVVAGVAAPSLELLLEPQPLIAETKNINVSGANAACAFDLKTIVTRSLKLVISGTQAAIE
jgi:hypothetical protein